MDSPPLPPRPDLAQYRKRAKALVAAARSSDDDAVHAWAADWTKALRSVLGDVVTPFVRDSIDRAFAHIETAVGQKRAADQEFALSDAQFLIADAHGFENWAAFAKHIESLSGSDSGDGDFEHAADAVVTGDLDALRDLLMRHPELIGARSPRVHRATLLHYVAANGVEDFRQKTPKNAVDVAKLLLDAGAEPDALADTYGRDTHQTTMNLLVSSTHPADAGLQPALVDTLIDYGAAANGVADDESPLMTALDFGYIAAAEALARRGARVDSVVGAAALGRLDLVAEMVVDAKTLKPGVPLVTTPWWKLPHDAVSHIELALVWACKFARSDVAMWLIERNVNPASKDNNKMTALHWAGANGIIAVIDELLRRGAPLEAENTWGGPVLNSTLHFVQYMPVAGADYPLVVERLLAAGADPRAADYPIRNVAIDRLIGAALAASKRR